MKRFNRLALLLFMLPMLAVADIVEIDGIGSARAKALLQRFKTVARIKQADIEELMTVKGMTLPAAEAVYGFYHKNDEPECDNDKE